MPVILFHVKVIRAARQPLEYFSGGGKGSHPPPTTAAFTWLSRTGGIQPQTHSERNWSCSSHCATSEPGNNDYLVTSRTNSSFTGHIATSEAANQIDLGLICCIGAPMRDGGLDPPSLHKVSVTVIAVTRDVYIPFGSNKSDQFFFFVKKQCKKKKKLNKWWNKTIFFFQSPPHAYTQWRMHISVPHTYVNSDCITHVRYHRKRQSESNNSSTTDLLCTSKLVTCKGFIKCHLWII